MGCATKFPFTKSLFTHFKCADTSQGMEIGFQWGLVVRTREFCWSGFHMSFKSKARKVKRAEGAESSVSRGVGVPSAALEKKVHVQNVSSGRRFPLGRGKSLKGCL